ncbi:substrate-binding domain-containing protein [Streptomyces sp. NPDC047081]|uniref:substrate-binding domain-containing protein n=1 Tax=Streptomyces sp. NPDC047081 TaxID=3154706 RepID=UPI0033E98884
MRQLPAHADLNLLRTFLAVYRSGSLTAAAPLDALAALEGGTGPLSGHTTPVHRAGPSELLCVRVLPALAPLVAEGVQLRVAQGLTDPLLEELRSGRHDLVIATRRPWGRALTSVPPADEEYVLVAAPLWTRQVEPNTEADQLCAALRDVPLVTYAEDLPIARRYWRTALGKQLTPPAAVTVPNLCAVLSAVNAGAGYSVLPGSLCQEHLDSGRLTLLHAPEEPPLNTLFLVQRPGADTNPSVIRVRDRLREAARSW